jgi:CRP-like cAMP-binding protein
MIIPTYWTGVKNEWKEGDAVYDHATPIDEDGTLPRTLESLKILNDKHFTLVIIGAVTNPIYVNAMEEKVKSIIRRAAPQVDTILFTDNNLEKLKSTLYKDFPFPDMLALRGYSNIRNLCLFIPYILDADIAILIDDDEVFEDADFIDKAKEFVGRKFYGNTVDGVAGYYLNEDNEYYDKVDIVPWMTYWDRFGGKREAFDKIIGSEPRLKQTPFAFGGAMVIHRNLMRIVPFDPKVTRGEDTDYVINSRIFGFNFYLDNQLAIKHLPPPKSHPVWKRFREDIYRFLYNKSKFDNQKEITNLHLIKPEDFDPYPGQFLKPDLGDKIFKTNIILALDYLANNKVEECKETIKNIYLARYEAIPHYNTYETYLQFQTNWRKLLEHTKGFGTMLKEIIREETIVKFDKYQLEKKQLLQKTGIENNISFNSMEIFKDFTKKEMRTLFFISDIIQVETNDFVFRTGDIDNNVYIVLHGSLQIIREQAGSGNSYIVAILKQGDHFNETAIFFQQKHFVSVQAIAPSSLMVIPNDKLQQLLDEKCELSSKILWHISKKLSEKLTLTTQKYSDSKELNTDVSDLLKNGDSE